MPHYHFLNRKRDLPAVEIREYSDDDAAIDDARRILGRALRTAAEDRQLLDDEIEVCREDGTVVAVVISDSELKH
jgi:hypothetical protein